MLSFTVWNALALLEANAQIRVLPAVTLLAYAPLLEGTEPGSKLFDDAG
jgi:hypothetical protein